MSHIGQQLVAPDGWGSLVKDRTYHFLGFLEGSSHVRLGFFSTSPNEVHFDLVPRTEFEDGLQQGALVAVASEKVRRLPPWLAALEDNGIDPAHIEDLRRTAHKKNRVVTPLEEVDRRFAEIAPLIDDSKNLLRCFDFEARVKAFARKSTPELNEKRTLLRFTAYLCFNRDKWVLLPSRHRCGRKSIQEKGPGDFGRPSPKWGGFHRSRMTVEIQAAVANAWKTHAKRGKTQQGVIAEILTDVLGYKERRVGSLTEFFHPLGGPVYTHHQLRYALRKLVGTKQMQQDLNGRETIRTKKKASRGRYSERVANLLEQVEGDAYSVEEVPRGPLDGNPMKPLYVVRIRCVGSGVLAGIGFSIGGERATAYRMALFCMAIGAPEFCALFGVKISWEDWPCKGLPSSLKIDRGPAGTADFIREFEAQIPIRELAPSYSGQSKATIESSNPRQKKTTSAPEYRQSKLNYVELAAREIRRTIAENRLKVMPNRQTINMARGRVYPTPLEIWRYLDSRFRTDAHPLTLEVAIPAFLTPVEFTVDEHGANLLGQVYRSAELDASGLCDRALSEGVMKVQGFGLEACFRAAWIRHGGRYLKVDLCLPIMDDKKQLFISLPELTQVNAIRKQTMSFEMEHRMAVQTEAERLFKEETGKGWHDGVTRRGRAKRGTAAAQAEQADVSRAARGGRRRA